MLWSLHLTDELHRYQTYLVILFKNWSLPLVCEGRDIMIIQFSLAY